MNGARPNARRLRVVAAVTLTPVRERLLGVPLGEAVKGLGGTLVGGPVVLPP